MIPLGSGICAAVTEFVAHYHGERNDLGIGNESIQSRRRLDSQGQVHRRERLGGMLSDYYRAAYACNVSERFRTSGVQSINRWRCSSDIPQNPVFFVQFCR